MKGLFFVLIVFVAVACASAQRTYELRCRGGGLKISTARGAVTSSGEQMSNVTVKFAAGTAPAGASIRSALAPGQCAWVDRGLRQGEPTEIRLEMVTSGQTKQILHGSSTDSSRPRAEIAPDATNMQDYLSSASKFWSFWVYNTNRGYFQGGTSRAFVPLVQVSSPLKPGQRKT